LPVPVARHPADGPPASALTAIHVPREWHRRPVAARRRFRIELLAFPPFPPAPRASLPPLGVASRHPYLATVVAHIRARPHNPARRMLPTPKNRNQKKVLRIHNCRRSLPRRSARNAIRVAGLRRAAALGDGRALPYLGLACVDSMGGHAFFSPMSHLVFYGVRRLAWRLRAASVALAARGD
jgi:hypothetical protein